MHTETELSRFRFDGSREFRIDAEPTSLAPIYEDKKDYKKLLKEYRKEIDQLQNMMYAHDRYGILLVFQAMDAAGKDGTIRHVMSGVNPHGVVVSAFKKPSDRELDHSFLWRTNCFSPERGKIHIFNRSYYEEVLVVKVHPEILTNHQKLPTENSANLDSVWESRYQSICDMERYEDNNGIKVVKFFLHVSKDEQRKRFIERIDRSAKNWKFSENDVKERQHWDKYMQAYEQVINATATAHAPWYVVPADDKMNMRIIVSNIVLSHLRSLSMNYPVVSDERKKELQHYKKMLEDE